ncbi:hypothetical protein GCM10008937_11100 [Deinococcus depolymerans]|uniref:thioredoxin-dependent peroxiredoxin n=1 Tax=Deinococcus depolymerans TaxID=392408 RepID=A0ABP3LQ56_9DEIO
MPEFTAVQEDGSPYLPAARRWRVLFFFPKTATTHCQLQARRYEALQPEFRALGIDVVGVNGDPRREQVRFRDLCRLTFPVLNDVRHEVTNLFGVLDEPWPGETLRRPRRETFLISPDGVIKQHWQAVHPGQDAELVLAAAQALLVS